MASQPLIRKGMVVRSRDGVPLGRVAEVDADGFVVERRLVVPRELRISAREVDALDGDDVILSWEREDLPG
ncbi:MAG: hypothetical protein L0Y66_09960, partial [Myxococcaceae bacterium]|nr:hypothetical protein [Myxococcaceae bacterium]